MGFQLGSDCRVGCVSVFAWLSGLCHCGSVLWVLPSWQRTSSAVMPVPAFSWGFQSEESVWAARIKLSAPLLQRLHWDLETQPKNLLQTVFTEQRGRGGRRHCFLVLLYRTKSKKLSDNSSLLVLSVWCRQYSLWTRLFSVWKWKVQKVPIKVKFFLLCLKLLMRFFIFIPMLVWKGKNITLTLGLHSVGLYCLLFSLLREEMFPVLINPVKSK